MQLEDISGCGQLEKLTLIECTELKDISMLGAVRYLTLQKMTCTLLPKPTGRLQEWKFVEILLSAEELNKLSGLHRFTWFPCYEVTELSGLSNIEHLRLNISNNCVISNLRNVQNLFVDNSRKGDVHLVSFSNVPHIQISNVAAELNLLADCQLRSLSLKHVKIRSWEVFNYCRERLRVLRIYCCMFGGYQKTPVIVNCWPALDVLDSCNCNIVIDNTTDNLFQESTLSTPSPPSTATIAVFDNFSIRTAVEMWCAQQSKAYSIYGDINTWDVSKVTDMSYLFCDKQHFNSNINSWNVSKVTTMSAMFMMARSFNHPLDLWNVGNVKNMEEMLYFADSFNQPIASWDVSNVSTMRRMFSYTHFNHSLAAWSVDKVANTSDMFRGATSFNQPLPRFCNVNNLVSMFCGASLFNQPLDTWDVSQVTATNRLFARSSFNQPLTTWNVDKVTHTTAMFLEASRFNQPLPRFMNLINAENMFCQATSFNQPVDSWDTSHLSQMSRMFKNAVAFNQPLASWDVSRARFRKDMFHGASSFNQVLDCWNIGLSTSDISQMFLDSGMQRWPEWASKNR
jgi:surface protein